MKLARLAALSGAMALAGCASQVASPDRFYRLDSPASSSAAAQGPAILFEGVHATGIYAERALVYRRPEAQGALEQYRQQFWAVPPAEMLDDGLRNALRAAFGAAQVHGRDTRADVALVISAQLLRMEQVLDAQGARAEYAVRFVATDMHRQPRWVLEVAESQPARSAHPADYVAALGELAVRAQQQLVRRIQAETPGAP